MTASAILIAAYLSVLLAEAAGDRSIYTIASLAARFGPLPVLLGVAPAHALKMLVAVLAAGLVSRLSGPSIAAVSCVTWLIAAWAVWRREPRGEESAFARLRQPSLIAFASIAFTEWGDPGQLTAALIAAQFRAPLLVWRGATAALLTKAAAALLLGIGARRYLNFAWIRFAAAAFCGVNAVIAAAAVVSTARH